LVVREYKAKARANQLAANKPNILPIRSEGRSGFFRFALIRFDFNLYLVFCLLFRFQLGRLVTVFVFVFAIVFVYSLIHSVLSAPPVQVNNS